MYKVYVEKFDQTRDWANPDFMTSAISFSKYFAYKVVPFYRKNIKRLKFEEDTILHATIQTTGLILNQLSLPLPDPYNHHIHLPQYCFRDFKEITLGDVKNLDNKKPFHIKPLGGRKLFTGKVIYNNYVDLYSLKGFPEDTQILYSEYLEFDAEFRCFILDKQLVGCKTYNGDFKLLPDFSVVENAIKDFKNQPIAYSLDFGIVSKDTDKAKKGQTVLIEINDATSLGSYGLDRVVYCKMIESRWREITKSLYV